MLLFALLRHQVNYICVPDTPGTSSFLSFFVFLCFYLSFQLLSSQCCQAVESASCWGHIRLCEQRLKRFSAERLLWKDLVTLVELQEAEIRNNSFLWRWEGEICYLFLTGFHRTGLLSVLPSLNCQNFISGKFFSFVFFFLTVLPVAHCSSLMSHLGHLYFGNKVAHVLAGLTPSHMASNPIKCILGEAGLITLLLQHAWMHPLCRV